MYTDTHAHIYLKEFNADRESMIEKAVEKGIGKIYMPNLDHASIDSMLETEARHPLACLPMMGLHPCYVKKGFEKELYLVEEWLGRRKFAAVGEVGIDLYWDTSLRKEQEEALKVQMGLASKYNLPIVIHCRNSMKETIALIKETGINTRGIFHCFSGTLEEAQEVNEMGFLLGIGGVATFKNGGLDKVLREIELKYLVLETDSPYLSPAPFRKERNDPSYIPLIAQRVADLKKVSLEEVARLTTENAAKIFRI